MARRRTITAIGIRLSLRPSRGQSAENYRQLMQDAFDRKLMVQVRGPEHMLISALNESSPREISGNRRKVTTSMQGVLSKFTDIDLTAEWFNSETLKAATAIDVREVTIPEKLKPNHSAFFIEYFPEVHTIIVESYGPGVQLSPRMAVRFFSRLFSDLEIAKKWGPVSASLIQHQAALDEIFGMKVLKKLTLVFEPPNADDGKKWEEHFEKRMEEEKLKKIEISLTAQSGKSIEASAETKAQAAAALEIGEVSAKGRDANGAPSLVSSLDFPDREPAKYDPDKKSEKQAFDGVSEQLIRRRRLDS